MTTEAANHQNRFIQSSSQTVGPFFSQALIVGGENILTNEQTQGQRIQVVFRVLDGDNNPIPDAMLEIWQADTNGIYAHPKDPRHAQADPHFSGFGRAATKLDGCCEFFTIKPGGQVPYINVRVFARGLLTHAVTRLYFAGTATDDVLEGLSTAQRQTLMTTQDGTTHRFEIHMQGEHETVFFDV